MIDMSRSNSSARLLTSRMRLCVQKNEAMREPRDRRDVVQARRRINDQVAGRQLHLVAAVGVLDTNSPPSSSSGAE